MAYHSQRRWPFEKNIKTCLTNDEIEFLNCSEKHRDDEILRDEKLRHTEAIEEKNRQLKTANDLLQITNDELFESETKQVETNEKLLQINQQLEFTNVELNKSHEEVAEKHAKLQKSKRILNFGLLALAIVAALAVVSAYNALINGIENNQSLSTQRILVASQLIENGDVSGSLLWVNEDRANETTNIEIANAMRLGAGLSQLPKLLDLFHFGQKPSGTAGRAPLNNARFSPDGEYVVTSRDKNVLIRPVGDIANNNTPGPFALNEYVNSAEFNNYTNANRIGKYLVVGTGEPGTNVGTIAIFDLTNGDDTPIVDLEVDGVVKNVIFSPLDDKLLIVGLSQSNENKSRETIRWGRWDPVARKIELNELPRTQGVIYASFAEKAVGDELNQVLLTVSATPGGGNVCLWRFEDGNPTIEWSTKNLGGIPSTAQITPNGSTILVATETEKGGEVIIWSGDFGNYRKNRAQKTSAL